jgi:drug/metabolite transporter (DMT)-like permease
MRQHWELVTWKGIAALGYMLVFANIVAYILHLFALTRLTAGQVAAFVDLSRRSDSVRGAVPHGRPDAELLIGAAVALAGVILVQLRRPAPAVE